MADADEKIVEEVVQRILPMIENTVTSLPDDPQKIWVILHYSDQLRVSNKTLTDLLQKLSNHDDPAVRLCQTIN